MLGRARAPSRRRRRWRRSAARSSTGRRSPTPRAALARLHERFKLGVITNCDDDLFAASRGEARRRVRLGRHGAAGEALQAEPARVRAACSSASGIPPARILHVAQSLYHDHVPAKRLGLSTVWVDRRGDRPGSGATPPAEATPDLTVPGHGDPRRRWRPRVSDDRADDAAATTRCASSWSAPRSSSAAGSSSSGSTPSRPRTATARRGTSPATRAACASSRSTRRIACCSSGSGATRPAARCSRSRPGRSTARRRLRSRITRARPRASSRRRPAAVAGTWRYLGGFYTAPGFTSELMHLYLATDLRAVDEGGLGAGRGRAAGAPADPVRRRLAMAERGEIRDAKSLIGLFWVARLREAEPERLGRVGLGLRRVDAWRARGGTAPRSGRARRRGAGGCAPRGRGRACAAWSRARSAPSGADGSTSSSASNVSRARSYWPLWWYARPSGSRIEPLPRLLARRALEHDRRLGVVAGLDQRVAALEQRVGALALGASLASPTPGRLPVGLPALAAASAVTSRSMVGWSHGSQEPSVDRWSARRARQCARRTRAVVRVAELLDAACRHPAKEPVLVAEADVGRAVDVDRPERIRLPRSPADRVEDRPAICLAKRGVASRRRPGRRA